jgi:di/tricarboxylate transporter
MTFDQALAFTIIAAMMALFIWGRLRYDIVGCLALLASVATGLVKPAEAFKGFSDDIVVVVASALVVSSAIAQTGLVELALQRISRYVSSMPAQLFVLVATVTVLSAFIKNIGALAIMIPMAFQMADDADRHVAQHHRLAGARRDDGRAVLHVRLHAVGAALALVGIAFLVLAYRLLPERTRSSASLDEALVIKNYVTDAEITEDSPMAGKSISEPAEARRWRGEGDCDPAARQPAGRPAARCGAAARRHGDPGGRPARAGARDLARQAHPRIRAPQARSARAPNRRCAPSRP